MKYFLVVLNIFVFQAIYSQENVFILVDVSGNPLDDSYRISSIMRSDAIELVKSIIINKYDISFNTNWELSPNADKRITDILEGKGKPLLTQGGYLMIMPFGEKDTYKKFKITHIQNYPNDFYLYYRFPFSYDQQRTFFDIAKARAADVALDINLSKYFLVVIMGKGEDTDSQTYSLDERRLLDNYSSSAIINSLATLRYKNPNLDFKVQFFA